MPAIFDPREAQRDFLYTKHVILFLLLLLSAAVSGWTFSKGFPYAVIHLAPATASGAIVDREVLGSQVWLTYEFVDRDGLLRRGSYRGLLQIAPDVRTGDSAAVLFSRPFPSIHQLEEGLARQQTSFYILVASTLVQLLILVVLGRNLLRLIRHHREQRRY